MRVLAVVAVLSISGPAIAGGGALTTHGGGFVLEASYHLDIEVRGLFATIESEQRLLAGSTDPVEAVYELQLPGDAAVTGFEVALGGKKSQPGVVITELGAIGEESSTIGADVGMLAQVAVGRPATVDDPGAPATYRYTVFPVGKDGATVKVRWVMPLRLEQGRLILALPARQGVDLAAPEGTIRFAPIAGLTAPRGVRVAGTVIAKAPGAKPTTWKLAAGAAVVIEAEIATKGKQPVVIADAVAIGKDRGAVAAAIVAPAVGTSKAGAAEHLVFVIDASRSMRRVERAAVVEAIGAVASAAPGSTKLEAIGFDQSPRRLLGSWKDNDSKTRSALADAVTRLGDANGTDLAGALAEAAALIEPGHATRIVVVTDGGLDPGVNADTLVNALGDRGADVDVACLVVVPTGRLAPGHGVAVLSDLARKIGGRVRIARTDELADRAARLSAELGDGAAWSNPVIAGKVDLAFPPVIAPGDGATAIGWYQGKPPRLAITLDHGGTAVKVSATRGGVAAGALALVQPGAMLALAGETTDEPSTKAVAAWTKAARSHGVVSPGSSALVVDSSTQLARDRRALIARGAPFARLPSRPERESPVEDAELNALLDPRTVVITDPLASSLGTGGTIDPDTLKNILTLELVARLRGCYQQALPRDPNLRGKVTFDILMGDGEVISVAALGARDTKFRACLVDAAHKIQVPQVADPSLIRVRYPVEFTVAADKSFVVLGDADSAEPIDPSLLPKVSEPIRFDDVDDPLGGIHK